MFPAAIMFAVNSTLVKTQNVSTPAFLYLHYNLQTSSPYYTYYIYHRVLVGAGVCVYKKNDLQYKSY